MNIIKSTRVVALALITTASLAIEAHASEIYTYTGQTFTEVVDSSLIPGAFTANASIISGSFTVAAPLAANMLTQWFTPTSFTFSDSVFTYTEANALYRHDFLASTDANGNLTQWLVELQDINPLQTSLDPLNVTHRLVTRKYVFVQDGAWHYVCGGPGAVTVALCDTVGYDLLAYDLMFQQARAGTWTHRTASDTDPNAIPLPGTLALVVVGLVGLSACSRRSATPGRLPSARQTR